MRWSEFATSCPEIGELAERRVRTDQLVFLGTVRSDGSARVSPCEIDLVDGELTLGMMWRSHKAIDLRRDPRLTVHSATADRMNPDGDVKIRGAAREILDAPTRARYRAVIRDRIGWAPDEPEFHVFAVDVEHAAYLRFGDDAVALVWSPAGGLEERELH